MNSVKRAKLASAWGEKEEKKKIFRDYEKEVRAEKTRGVRDERTTQAMRVTCVAEPEKAKNERKIGKWSRISHVRRWFLKEKTEK